MADQDLDRLIFSLRDGVISGDWEAFEAAAADDVALEHPGGRIDGREAVFAFLRGERLPPLREVVLLAVGYGKGAAFQSYNAVPHDVGRFVPVIDELHTDDEGRVSLLRTVFDPAARTPHALKEQRR